MSEFPPADRQTVDPHRGQLGLVANMPADQPVTMLNLVRFREVADYRHAPDLAPQEQISGQDAYRIYIRLAAAHLTEVGATLQADARCGPSVIGPDDERWDRILLVTYPNPKAFIDMVRSVDYQTLSAHRTAALCDSRLIPTSIGGAPTP